MSNGFWISMVLIDNIKPRAHTGLEAWNRWMNNMQSELIAMTGRKIEVIEL